MALRVVYVTWKKPENLIENVAQPRSCLNVVPLSWVRTEPSRHVLTLAQTGLNREVVCRDSSHIASVSDTVLQAFLLSTFRKYLM